MISDSTDTISGGTSVVGYDDDYPYGSIMGGNRSQTSSAEAGYKFTGKYKKTETGFDYFGARYYDSWTGRFLSVDPMSKKYPSFSPYNYTLDNPLRLVDPHGESIADPLKGPLPCCNTYPRTFIEWGNNFTSFLTTKIKTATKTTLENVAKYADQASKASETTGEIGIGMAVVGTGASMVAPEAGVPEGTAATGLALVGISNSVGEGSDFVSTVTTGADALFFGGSTKTFYNHLGQFGLDVIVGKSLARLIPESVQSGLKSNVISTFKEATDMITKQMASGLISK